MSKKHIYKIRNSPQSSKPQLLKFRKKFLFWDDENVLKLTMVIVACTCEYAKKKPIELYTLSGSIVWYVNSISIKLVKNL